MTQKDKELLLIDLCAREPYHPKINVFNNGYEGFQDGEFDTNLWFHHIDAFRFDRIEIKPYLRPRYSMTEEEKKEFYKVVYDSMNIDNISPSAYVANWEYSNHFDVWGLIPKGLAIAITEENNPYE